MSRFAAIDIGSNAVRLMIARVEEKSGHSSIRKEAFLRIPLRLGADVFKNGEISVPLQTKLIKTMEAFQNLLTVFDPLSYRACATSAMRDARNGAETVRLIEDHTGINLKIIDGQEEALTVFSSHIQQQLNPEKAYLFIDVGGGSTELLLYQKGKVTCSRSFNVGTVRILNGIIQYGEWEKMTQWVKKKVAPIAPVGIGSGGNINRLNRMAKKEEKKSLSRKTIKQIYQQINTMTLDDRMNHYGLKPDRADVIVPATLIYLKVMEWGNMSTIHVPKSGLCDGLIRQQYDEFIAIDKKTST